MINLSRLFNTRQEKNLENEAFTDSEITSVNINWRNHFSSISYVRHVSVIVNHQNYRSETEYGSVLVGYYLNECNYGDETGYLQGDVFIICDRNELYDVRDEHSIRSMYYLVQINKDSHKGFEILNKTSDQNNYPWHQNILVSSIIKDRDSFPSIKILNKDQLIKQRQNRKDT